MNINFLNIVPSKHKEELWKDLKDYNLEALEEGDTIYLESGYYPLPLNLRVEEVDKDNVGVRFVSLGK